MRATLIGTMGLEKGVDATKGFLKNHWIAFAVVATAIVILTLAYDHKHPGQLTAKVSSWPLVGKLFT